jgi:UDP-N-acetylmuramoylalanine--D-glutamate ligase
MAGEDFSGVRATVMGLGVLGGGTGVARFLAERGAIVTVTDMRPEADLLDSMTYLADLDITYHLGGHDERDFTAAGADMVVRNPGVRRDSPYLAMARADGVRVEMEMSLFFRACPAPIIGVTGTKGKTTVTSLIGEMLRAWDPTAFVAGNMGISALEGVSRLTRSTPVAIELSSWQIESLLEHQLSPHVAVFTNFSEDHLDRYDGFEDYVNTKRGMAFAQSADDVVVYNIEDSHVRLVADQTPARRLGFGTGAGSHVWADAEGMHVRWSGTAFDLPLPGQLSLQGAHGQANALAAVAACIAYGVPDHAIRQGLDRFRGVENRLEELGAMNGVAFINDTSATAPIATVMALRLLHARGTRVHLISGGADKQSDMREMIATIAECAASVVLLPGSATPTIANGLRARDVDSGPPVESMDEAVGRAYAEARPGDVVLLSPGVASFGLFRNEFDRGRQFKAAFARLTGANA